MENRKKEITKEGIWKRSIEEKIRKKERSRGKSSVWKDSIVCWKVKHKRMERGK